MTAFVAYVPIYKTRLGSPSKGLMKRRFQVRDFVCDRGRLLAEFLDATRLGTPESVVLREARRFAREHEAVLLIAAGGPLRVEASAVGQSLPAQADGGPLSSTVLPSGSSM
ncbi:MAG: hypothetical protein QNJ30_01785 [Kiloniellales bacterium]|nr:hypothetical protein [Kiloniellales bacterium]